MKKIIYAKALRSSFSSISNDLLKEDYMDDVWLLEKVRRMQQEYREFNCLAEEIKEANYDLYKKEILGIVA